MTNSTSKVGVFVALPVALALITAAFADTANAKPLAEPTINQMNKCALTGTIKQVGSTHIKCCTKKYCIWCNITTDECWIKRRKSGAASFVMTPRPALKLGR